MMDVCFHRNYILMQNKALDELRRLVAYLCQAAGIALPNIAAMVGGIGAHAVPLQIGQGHATNDAAWRPRA